MGSLIWTRIFLKTKLAEGGVKLIISKLRYLKGNPVKYTFIFVSSILLLGCSSNAYNRPGVTAAQRDQDLEQCKKSTYNYPNELAAKSYAASQTSGMLPTVADSVRPFKHSSYLGNLLDSCMASRGYSHFEEGKSLNPK